ncbi:MAG: PD-(D/E)XK nuclease family protein, partial [Faecousia sp.]
MLHLLLGRDWTANRDAVFSRISEDVKMERPGRILMVPELISHETERTLCSRAGDTASRFAEVLSFTRLARRVAERAGSANVQCLDSGGRVVAMAASARQLASKLKAYASVETKPEFLEKLIEAVDEFKRCCISPEDLLHASEMTEGSLAQKLEELSLLMAGYDALCARGKRDPRDQMTWLLEQLEEGSFAQSHVFYIEGFPDFTRQHFAILECLIRLSPSVTVSINCDVPGSRLLAFEKAGDTAAELLRCARRAGVEVRIETIAERNDLLVPLRNNLFQGPIREGSLGDHLSTVCAASVWQECLAAGQRVRSLVMEGCRYRDITLVVTDMAVYQPVLEQVFERLHIPLYRSGTEDIMQKNVICTVLTALDAAVSGFDRKSVLEYFRSALSPLDQDTCDLVENYAVVWNIRGNQWLTDWAFHPDGLSGVWDEPSQLRLQALNEARALAITPLEHLRQGLQGAASLREQVLVLYA